MHSQNWDDLRFVLAVAEEGSVSAAARILRVNHATVLRRIAAYEDRIGLQIFDRTAQGYVVPTDHSRVIDAAREVQAAITAMDRVAQGVESKLGGTLRITTTDTVCVSVMPAVIAELHTAGEGLRVEMSCTNAHLNLSRLEADITIRPAMRLADGLVGERSGVLGVAAYAPADDLDVPWLGLRGVLDRSAMADAIEAETQTTDGADSFVALREMVAAGLGQTLLPCAIAEGDARLRRLDRPDLERRVPIWVASAADIGGTLRLREIRSRIATALARQADRLLGPISPG